jgi:hypothetical protein
MRPSFIAIIAFSALTWASPSQAQTLTLLGTPNFGIDPEITLAPYTQSSTSFTINGTLGLGDGTLGGGFLAGGVPTTYDWSGVIDFALTMSVTGTNPNLQFRVELFDSLAKVAEYEGTTAGLTSTPTLVSLNETFRGSLSNIIGMQVTFDGSGAINTTIENITAVPEPSTWALLFVGAALFGGLALRRRLAAVRR